MDNTKPKLSAFTSWLIRWTTITFIALRAADVISWPWYALLSPILLHIAFVLLCAAVVVVKVVKDGL